MIDTEALRKKVIDLAIQGKLTEQLPEDGDAESLYTQIQEEKAKLIKNGKIKKEKPLPDISSDEIPYEIPKSWKWCRLGEVYCVLMGQSPDGMNVGTDIDGMEFHQGKIYFGEKYLKTSEQKTSELTRVTEANSVLLCVRAPVGVVNITKRQICIGRGLCSLSAVGGMDPYYLFYYLLSCRKSFEQSSTGSTFSAITVDVVKKHLIPIPPIQEQQRIVMLLDNVFNQFTVIDTLQQQYQSNLSVLKNKIIDAGIRGKLTEQLPEDSDAETLLLHYMSEKKRIMASGALKGRKQKNVKSIDSTMIPFSIPTSWKWICLDDVAEIFGRIGFRGYKRIDIVEKGKGAITISPSNILDNGKTVFDECTYLSWKKYEESPEIKIEEDDVIIVKTGSSYGKCGIVKNLYEKATINPQIAVLKYVLCDKRYLNYVLNSSLARKQYEEFVVGAAIPTFSQEKLASLIMPLPPAAEQKRVADRIDELMRLIE